MQKSVDLTEIKNVEPVDSDALQEIRKQVTDGSAGDKLASASVEELYDVSANGAVDQSQLEEILSKTSEKTGVEDVVKPEPVEYKPST